MSGPGTITEADLHAYVDEQLPAGRRPEIDVYLAARPAEAQRIGAYRAQRRELHALFDAVLDEAPPPHLLQAARPRLPWFAQRIGAAVAIALLGVALGWAWRGDGAADAARAVASPGSTPALIRSSVGGFAQRAAIAHAVYSPDQRRSVEVAAADEDQLVAWLSQRIGAPMRPPQLQSVGYQLEGGRLLPGGQGPVAQFMYSNRSGGRLSLYISNELGDAATGPAGVAASATWPASLRHDRRGRVNVFYWVDGPFGYAVSADADHALLAGVSNEVYRQIGRQR